MLGTFIELSTSHVTQETMELIEQNEVDCTTWTNEFGAFISTYVFGSDEGAEVENMPDDLRQIIDYALSKNASYILLNWQVEPNDELPVCDW